jgi:predicted transcriptional regulator of viral defense system
MAWGIVQGPSGTAWAVAKKQYGVVTRRQLMELGFSPRAIEHRLRKGRLHPVSRGVYAVGRPELSRRGVWMAAVLGCGGEAILSHDSAGALWGIAEETGRAVHVSLPAHLRCRRTGIVPHRRASLAPADVTRLDGIPVTTPTCTILDLATRLARPKLEAVVNRADKLGLVAVDTLRAAAARRRWRRGAPAVARLIDRSTFVLTDSELERRFLPIARRAGLPPAETGRYVNGFKVDFFWSELGLVVETDGLRYHRTPLQQARDRTRDQAHLAAGLTPLRFIHAQVAFEPEQVELTLSAVARRLARRRTPR